MMVGSLFTGIGGFDLPARSVGWKTKWMVERDKNCCKLLAREFPESEIIQDDIRTCWTALPAVDVLVGGDPCPKHSRAKGAWPSKHPDLSGYFLAVVGRLRPRWVVRENVLSPTVGHFAAGMDLLGYGTIVVRLSAANLTGQARERDFVVAHRESSWHDVAAMFDECQRCTRIAPESFGLQVPVLPCLTSHISRYFHGDVYIYDVAGNRLRVLDGEERERIAGFPAGWTRGFSESTRARMLGNAVIPACAEYIFQRLEGK